MQIQIISDSCPLLAPSSSKIFVCKQHYREIIINQKKYSPLGEYSTKNIFVRVSTLRVKMRNNLAVAFLALLGSANGQWKAQRHFEEGGTSVNPVYRQTRQLEQYYSAYRNDLTNRWEINSNYFFVFCHAKFWFRFFLHVWVEFNFELKIRTQYEMWADMW